MEKNEGTGISVENDPGDSMERSKEIILDAASRCRNCNYCFAICPLFHSTRGFMSQTPSGILQSIKYGITWDLLSGKEKEILRDLVYSCTTCNGCVIRCKSKATGIKVRDAIEAGRKILREMMIGPLPQQRKPLWNIYTYGNPYGEKPERRLDWLDGLAVKRLPAEQAEVLLYVGCTIAYDPPLHPMGRSLIRVLTRLGVDFGVLENEVCCGDPALRMGDEAVFLEMVEKNRAHFKSTGVTKIVTASPHCYNSFIKEYPSLREEYTIRHYTEFLLQTLRETGRTPAKAFPFTVTYHDPCYLGKHNQIYGPPRDLLKMIPGLKLVEMRMKMDDALCCGGGGGRMYAEVEEEKRLARMRVSDAIGVGAEVIATACPWCFTMIDNAVRDMQLGDRVKVMDIAQILEHTIEE
jgi:Fe-S oxidoreductase